MVIYQIDWVEQNKLTPSTHHQPFILLSNSDDENRVGLLNDHCILVTPGDSFKEYKKNKFEIDCHSTHDYEKLFLNLIAKKLMPQIIIHTYYQVENNIDSEIQHLSALFQALDKTIPSNQPLYFVWAFSKNKKTILTESAYALFNAYKYLRPSWRLHSIQSSEQ